MKKLLVLAAVVAIAAALAVPALAATKSIKIGDDYFVRSGSAPVVTVSKGTTVTWVWRGKVAHNLGATGPQHFSTSAKVRGSFKHKMTRRGTYRIFCSIHPGMQMTLKVR
jgi:plastocyanin